MPDTALEIRQLSAGYVPGLPIIRDVSMQIRAAQITVIIGPNGAGKSTLLKAVAGLVPIEAGAIRYLAQDITGVRPDLLAQHGVAYVPQTDNIFRTLSVAQNIDLALRGAGAAAAERRDALYDQFPQLADKRRNRAGTLSGGQRQFLALAMALATAPKLILLDEPSAGLAPKAAQEVLQHARTLTAQGTTILLVEQNVKQALHLSDHCYILAEGRYQIDGPARELLADPVVGEIYLGRKREPVS